MVPEDIQFGLRFEDKARQLFVSSHRYRHKNCFCEEPGLILNGKYPFLGASPDGILHCDKCQCAKTLIEIKCLSSKRNYHPESALILSGICKRDSDGNLHVVQTHAYYYQMQGQMALCDIQNCWLVAYTHKGIKPVLVNFDPEFWNDKLNIMDAFYREAFLPVLKGGLVIPN